MEGSEKYHLPSRRGLGGGALPSEGLEFPFLCYWGLTQGLTLGRRALSTSLYLQPRTWVSWGKILELLQEGFLRQSHFLSAPYSFV